MQTHFTAQQLEDPRTAEANSILRSCVHCGFCTATCPTYVLLGDELDSPRGRIYLMKEMLEKGGRPSPDVVKHVDRCLSCLSCMTTCPSGVHYMHLVDEARIHIENHGQRPLALNLMRSMLAFVMPRPAVFRTVMQFGKWAKPFAGFLGKLGFTRLQAALRLVPSHPLVRVAWGDAGIYPAQGQKLGSVALLKGCVQSVTAPHINAAAIRLLTRQGYEVIVTGGESCCGSLTHHMGKEADAKARAARSIRQWQSLNVDYVVSTATGCGSTIKDYGHMFKHDQKLAAAAESIAQKTKDLSELLAQIELPQRPLRQLRVAYHAACSLQHGQKTTKAPVQLLERAGFTVVQPRESHLCCGSAGTYNMLQPDLAQQLAERKAANINALSADLITAGNLGCMTQLAPQLAAPMVHLVELLDWAYGGPCPAGIQEK